MTSYPWESDIAPTTPSASDKKDKPFVVICTPTASPYCHHEWATSLIRIMRSLPFPYSYVNLKGVPIDVARNLLARDAIKSGAEWIFWLDDDVVPEKPTIIQDLISYSLPFTSGMYYAKKLEGVYPCAYIKNGDKFNPLRDDLKGLIETDLIGFGCALTSVDLFRKITHPWFYWDKDRMDEKGEEMKGWGSEDFYFCTKVLKELNIRPVVDFNQRCHHLGSFAIRGDGNIKLSRP